MHGVDTVIHAAALKRIEVGTYNPTEMAATNVQGTTNALLASEAEHVKRFVLVSSDKAFAPVNAYGASKLLAERIVLGDTAMRGRRRPMVRVCRYGNVAGSTGSVIPIWRAAMQRGAVAKVTDPDATRFWMTREEAAGLVINAAALTIGPDVMIPDLPAFRIGDLAEAMGIEARVIGLQPGEKMHESMEENACSRDARRMTIAQLREGLRDV
jgi:UDP-N-acetylglucosamine 4,6-dehydratase